MSVAVHSFPSFNGLNARSISFVAIVAIHGAFFWVFTSGLARDVLVKIPGVTKVLNIPLETEPEQIEIPEPEPSPVRPDFPIPVPPDVLVAPTDTPIDLPVAPGDGVISNHASGSGPAIATPVIAEPRIDARHPLAEPVYPAQEIRLNHTGTVLLSVQVLGDGSIGDIQIARSSGYPRLDQAAVRAAKQWKLVPGTRDGVAMPMWKQIPVTFKLQ